MSKIIQIWCDYCSCVMFSGAGAGAFDYPIKEKIDVCIKCQKEQAAAKAAREENLNLKPNELKVKEVD